ncbi:hypothetical protein SDC9_146793 [bioreactor metagenome]|uniref:Uncharacterized protein n=1 Tax=bioreactor metagenome TaxID=1076179 RepID=A0A645EE97_9ZZZZ
MNRVHAGLDGNRKQDGCCHQDDGGHVHDGSQNQHQYVQDEHNQQGIAGKAENTVGNHLRQAQVGKQPAEHLGGGDEDHDDGQGAQRSLNQMPNLG